MQKFIEYILQFGSLDQQQIEFISKRGEVQQLRKDEYFAEAGKALKSIGFLLEGIIRIYYHNDEGEEITLFFIDENHLIAKWWDEKTDIVLSQYLQAATDCTLIVFSENDLNEISGSIAGWDGIIQKISTKNHTDKLERRSPLVSQDATTRYLDFIQKFPALINRIPLSYIASYLGITQSSLSRIRKKIS